MKALSLFLVLAVAMTLAMAEPPRRRFRPAWAAPQRQVADTPAEEAPYPPSGWRPSKAFHLPGEYGAPDPGYGTPTEEAETTTTEAAETTTAASEEGTTTEATTGEEEARSDDDYDEDTEPEPAPANIPAPGVYYVLLPDGTIQRVAYQAVIPAPPSGRYIVEEVEPLRAPIYAYGTPRLIRLLKK